jgi:uncharacterized membrane protein YecN with MAPEG domain
MIPDLWPVIAAAVAIYVYAWTFVLCGRARAAHKIAAPATTGHPEFERAFRVQQNTLEQIAIFLPSLWIFSVTVDPKWAGIIGLVWSLGRVIYGVSYIRNPNARGPGFIIGALSSLILLVGGTIGLAKIIVDGM